MRRFVVAGAGMGGLATALALTRAGEGVTVLERRPGLAEFGAGVQLAPNATRILKRLGLLEPIQAVATEPEAVRIRRGRDGAELAVLPLGRAAVARYGAPFLLLHRPDLQRVLAEAVRKAADLTFDADVDEVTTRSGDGQLCVATDRRRWSAAGFIDARGARASGAARRTAWRALLPAENLAPRHRQACTNLWLGPRTHLVHYPICRGALVNVVAITEDRGRTQMAADPWSHPGDPVELRRAFAGWHRDSLDLLDPTADWRRWPLFDGAAAPAWSRGRTTRVGDAAHPTLPFLAQGVSQAIEDAAALAAALAHEQDVATAFTSYERMRRPRATRVQAASRRQGDVYHLARPAADARDLAMRLMGGAGALARLDWLYGRG